jgi:ubiquinone/menaquinone biosynthesis C-methylase UbiE
MRVAALRLMVPAKARADDRAYYDETRRVYGSWFAAIYDLVCLPLRRLRKRVARLASIGSGARLLDVATGTGAQAGAFADAGAAVVGVDLSPRMLAIARRKHPGVTFVEGDATASSAGDASFDAACISFALHEMPGDVRGRVLDEMVRVVHRDGRVIIVDFAPPHGVLLRVVSRLLALFERSSYRGFLRDDLGGALARRGVEVIGDRRALFGVARILVGRRVR